MWVVGLGVGRASVEREASGSIISGDRGPYIDAAMGPSAIADYYPCFVLFSLVSTFDPDT